MITIFRNVYRNSAKKFLGWAWFEREGSCYAALRQCGEESEIDPDTSDIAEEVPIELTRAGVVEALNRYATQRDWRLEGTEPPK